MTPTPTELALAKIDEIITLLQGSDNPLDQLILMAALTTKGSAFSYDTAMILKEALKDVNERAIRLMEAQQQDYITENPSNWRTIKPDNEKLSEIDRFPWE